MISKTKKLALGTIATAIIAGGYISYSTLESDDIPAFDISPTLFLDDFTRSPVSINVTNANGQVTCALDLRSTDLPFFDAGEA
jgi:hypothetical protein